MNQYYDDILSYAEEYLVARGFSRSGKSPAFYKLARDNKRGGIILFRRSIYASYEHVEFSINYAVVSENDVVDCSGNGNVTVAFLKKYVSASGLSFDIFRIDDLKMKNERPGGYFSLNIEKKIPI